MSRCSFSGKPFLSKQLTGQSRFLAVVFVLSTLFLAANASGAGPLSVNALNSRYFFDSTGAPVYLAGTYIDPQQIELGTKDFTAYLDYLRQQKHNFTRLWAWEQTPSSAATPMTTLPYERSGRGQALDGGSKFDLRRLNQDYFDQLRARVVAAAERGIYVSVVLFKSLDSQSKIKQDNPWYANPFNRDNNVNRINGDTNGDGIGAEAFTLTIPAITSLQEAYIRKIVDTLNDLDNVLYEISGDSPLGDYAWQSYIINYLKNYQANKRNQHPVGINAPAGTSDSVFNSPADWIAFFGADLNPPVAAGGKVLFVQPGSNLLDTSSGHQSVWKRFARGFNIVDKEPDSLTPGIADAVHGSITQTLAYSQMINLVMMTPSDLVCSTGYCLLKSGAEYLVYLPIGGSVTVDLSGAQQNFSTAWFDPPSGQTSAGTTVNGGGRVTLVSPFKGETVLHLLVQRQLSTALTTTSASPTSTITSSTSTATSLSMTSTSTSGSSSKKTTASTPTITPDGGAFAGAVSVSLASATPGATIYYTTDGLPPTDGSSPTQTSKKYSGPITVSTDGWLKATAVKNNANPSPEAKAWFSKTSSFDFTLNSARNVSVMAGASVSNTISATLATGSAQAVLFSVFSGVPAGASASFSPGSCSPSPTCSTVLNITTTGSTPTGNFSITVNATGGGVTRTTSFTLSVTAPAVISTVATPTITPNGGNFITSIAVSMATPTSGASIYYTLDGSTPTTSSILYAGTFNLTRSATIRAKAFKSGYNQSAEGSATFQSDLVAYWKFDEGTGITASDSSGNGNHGTLVNGPQWSTGIAGKALYFNGSNNNVLVPDSNSLDLTGPYTLSAWVNPATPFADFRSILVKNYRYYLYSSVVGYCGDGTPLGGFSGVDNNIVCDSISIPANTWTNISLAYDGLTLTLYRNGVSVASSTASEQISPTPGTLQIGASEYGEFFKGLIDEVRVYNRALTSSEIQSIYGQNARTTPSFDFALANSGTISAIAGSSGKNTTTASLLSGSAQSISFSVAGLPSGTTASFSSTTCTPTCSTILTIGTSGSTPTGSYSITVSGTGGGVTKTTSFALSITAGIALTVATPTITPNGGNFSGSVSVALQTATPGASIYYTTDGSTPTQSSSLYTGAMSVTNSATLNAKAYMSGYSPSTMASAFFTIAENTRTYYVAKTGNDANSCSSTSPCLTLSKATGMMSSGDTLIVSSGTYTESLPNGVPSGTSWSNVTTIKSKPGDSVTLRPSGSSRVVRFGDDKQFIAIDGLVLDGINLSRSLGGEAVKLDWDTDQARSARYIRITNCEIKNAPGQGILSFGTGHQFINNRIHDNGFYCGAAGSCHGIYHETDNALIEQNSIYNNEGFGIHIYNGYDYRSASNNIIRFNKVYDNGKGGAAGVSPYTSGIIVTSGSDNKVYNNLVWNNKQGIRADYSASNTLIYNNTIYNNAGGGDGGYCVYNGKTSSSTYIRNNICWQNSSAIVDVSGAPGVTSNNLTTVDPNFSSPTSGDFHLQAGSAAIDMGMTLVEVGPDMDGVARPQGVAYDAGAYEYRNN